MSLQLAAQHLAAHGRGPDNTLVHMTPKEVASLQALAQQHGGSLTINPKTGLPEAGFLSSILPLVAGVGLTAMGMPAGLAALTVGGGTAMATGSLGKGLMAGLGAYGGSGLAESLIGSGAAGMAPEAAAAAANAVPTETAAQLASANTAGLTPAAIEPSLSASLPTANAAADPFRLGSTASQEGLKATASQEGLKAANPIRAAEAVKAAAPQTVTMSPADMTASQRFGALKAGATGQNLLNYAKANPIPTAGMLAGPLMSLSENNAPTTPTGDSDRGAMANAGYQYDPGWSNPLPSPDPYGKEQVYNRPRYYIPKAADGGAVQHFDNGGMVDGFNQTPELKKFLELQAARAAQAAPTQINVKQQFADYLKTQAGSTPTPTPTYTPSVIEPLPTTPASQDSVENVVEPRTGGGGDRGVTSFEPGAGLAQFGGSGFTGATTNAYGDSGPTTGLASLANKGATYLGNLGLTGLSDAIAKNVDTNYGHEGAIGIRNAAANAPDQSQAETARLNAKESDSIGFSSREGDSIGFSSRGGSNSVSNGTLADHVNQQDRANSRDSDARGGFLNNGKFDQRYAYGGGIAALADGGMYNLGSYSDGGRLLRGPGDGVSDSIPAVIGQKQPARLADGEFVIPARIVSELGNGSTEAGARRLYAMMDKVQNARKATVGKGKVAKNTRADKYLPA